MPRGIISVPVNQVVMDRTPLDAKVLLYAMAMMRGDKFPPIRVARRRTGAYEIRDGRHRVTAARLAHVPRLLARCADQPLDNRPAVMVDSRSSPPRSGSAPSAKEE